VHRTKKSNSGQGPSLQDVALEYANLGWHVLPVHCVQNGICACPKREQCQSPGKHPRTRRGHAGATIDPKVISRWKWETANIGIATGSHSGLLVIDVDFRSGGQESLNKAIEQYGKLPSCPTVCTGGGGWHLYFRHPGGQIKSRTITPGLDRRQQLRRS
jgi:hypothetical protein